MENEIMNTEVTEELVEAGKVSGWKKGAIVIGVAGLVSGLAFVGYKFGKKLVAKMKNKRVKKIENHADDDEEIEMPFPNEDEE